MPVSFLLIQLMIFQSFSPRVKVKANGTFIISYNFDPIKNSDDDDDADDDGDDGDKRIVIRPHFVAARKL